MSLILGADVGIIVGIDDDDSIVGSIVGSVEGSEVRMVKEPVDSTEGLMLGDADGRTLGTLEGRRLGGTDGKRVGNTDE